MRYYEIEQRRLRLRIFVKKFRRKSFESFQNNIGIFVPSKYLFTISHSKKETIEDMTRNLHKSS